MVLFFFPLNSLNVKTIKILLSTDHEILRQRIKKFGRLLFHEKILIHNQTLRCKYDQFFDFLLIIITIYMFFSTYFLFISKLNV